MDAIVSGTLAFGGDCVHLIQADIEYPVVWPFGASWEPDLPAVVLGAEVFEPGVTVTGGGGWLNRERVESFAGASVANAAAECIGPTGEIAFFNIGSDVEVTR